jgi:hypothetical protein
MADHDPFLAEDLLRGLSGNIPGELMPKLDHVLRKARISMLAGGDRIDIQKIEDTVSEVFEENNPYAGDLSLFAADLLISNTDRISRSVRGIAERTIRNLLTDALMYESAREKALETMSERYAAAEMDAGQVYRAISLSDNAGTLKTIAAIALDPGSGDLSVRQARLLSAVAGRVREISAKNPYAAIDFLVFLKERLDKYYRTAAPDAGDILLGTAEDVEDISRTIIMAPGLTYEEKPEVISAIIRAGLLTLAGKSREAAAALDKAKKAAAGYEDASMVLASMRIAAYNGDLASGEYGLKLLARMAPAYVPQARIILASAYFDKSSTPADDLARRGSALWPQDKTGPDGGLAEPPVFERSAGEELIEHLLKAPVRERLFYFGLPVLMAFMAYCFTGQLPPEGLTGIMPLGGIFNIFAGTAYLPFLWKFIRAHRGERAAAWAAGIGSLFPMLFTSAPLVLMALSVAVHTAVNTAVYALNAFRKAVVVNYATIIYEKFFVSAAMAPEKERTVPRGVIGITGISSDLFETLSENETIDRRMMLINVNDRAELKASAEKAGISSSTRMAFIEPAEGTDADQILQMLKGAVRMLELRVITDRYPLLVNNYLSGKQVSGILGSRDREDIASIISDLSVDEISTDVLDSLMRDYYSGSYTRGDGPLYRLNRESEGDWFADYLETLENYQAAISGGKATASLDARLKAMHDELNTYLTRQNPQEMRQTLIRHHDIAMARRMENASLDLIDRIKVSDAGFEPLPQAIVIDGREKAGFDTDVMAEGLLRLARSDALEVALIADERIAEETAEKLRKAGIVMIRDVGSGTPEDIIDSVRREIRDIPAEAISIATGEFMRSQIIEHINSTGDISENTSNFVIAGTDIMRDDSEDRQKVSRMMPAFAAMNLVRRNASGRPEASVIAVAVGDETLKAFEDILSSIVAIRRIDMNYAIRSFVESMRAIAVSL